MDIKRTLLFSVPYFVFGILVIAVKMIHFPEYENFFKPLLLLTLMIWFAVDQKKKSIQINVLFLLALFFSLLGDVFLMPLFENFILGLVFFLISHVFYIFVFLKNSGKKWLSILKEGKVVVITIGSIYLGLLLFLIPQVIKLDSLVLLIAVPIYASVLFVMVLSTFIYSKLNYKLFSQLVFLGGLFFLFSDGVLAINKFAFDVPYSPILVMGTYTVAQWLLVFGFQNRSR